MYISGMDGANQPLLEVEELSIGFEGDQGVTAITDKVSFTIRPGEAYGLVGESGCGKSVTCLSLLKLLPVPGGRVLSGRILFRGRDILKMNPEELRNLRGGEIGMIFQEPGAALNPLWPIRRQLLEAFHYHDYKGDPQQRIRTLLDRVGIADPDRILSAYPHQLSGGMLQRVMIAMALSLNPALLIADEPTTALDVTVQAQIMELIEDLRREFNASVLMVTHNLNLIAQYADRVGVMYAGRLVEESPVEDFLDRTLHPYSAGLLAALPRLDRESGAASLRPIPGQVPRPADYLEGCRFRDRCPHAFEACVAKPDLFPMGSSHTVACFLYGPGGSRTGRESLDPASTGTGGPDRRSGARRPAP
ncbi:MAG: Peptide transporter ATP-binding protein [Fibrobacteres bacterium]|nr:Peptide transporter ATP-binding protein [Fibrobacterota bacterium]